MFAAALPPPCRRPGCSTERGAVGAPRHQRLVHRRPPQPRPAPREDPARPPGLGPPVLTNHARAPRAEQGGPNNQQPPPTEDGPSLPTAAALSADYPLYTLYTLPFPLTCHHPLGCPDTCTRATLGIISPNIQKPLNIQTSRFILRYRIF
jgi:hypothetical protein